MRDFIFIVILAAMAVSAVIHVRAEAWTFLSIDLVIAIYAWTSWRPLKRRR